MIKNIAAAAGLATAILAGSTRATEAQAGVDIDVGIGLGIPSGVYVEPYPVYPGWRHRIYYANRRVSCAQGARIVLASGFNRVMPIECRGANYRYIGREGGRTFEIHMRPRTGRIFRVFLL